MNGLPSSSALLLLVPCIALYLVANVVVVQLLFALARKRKRRVDSADKQPRDSR